MPSRASARAARFLITTATGISISSWRTTWASTGRASLGVALSEDVMEQAGMGVGVGDLDLDGNLDIIKTHFSADTPGVYLNDGSGNFWDVTRRSGLAVETRYIGWGVGVADLDNDGNPDIFEVTGGIYPELQNSYKTPRLIFRSLGKGRFEELVGMGGPGVDTAHSSRGCA